MPTQSAGCPAGLPDQGARRVRAHWHACLLGGQGAAWSSLALALGIQMQSTGLGRQARCRALVAAPRPEPWLRRPRTAGLPPPKSAVDCALPCKAARSAADVSVCVCVALLPACLQVVDTTGAGDLFAAGFLYSLIQVGHAGAAHWPLAHGSFFDMMMQLPHKFHMASASCCFCPAFLSRCGLHRAPLAVMSGCAAAAGLLATAVRRDWLHGRRRRGADAGSRDGARSVVGCLGGHTAHTARAQLCGRASLQTGGCTTRCTSRAASF